jgi:predicted enzyme related to lactoylglutathione lyase
MQLSLLVLRAEHPRELAAFYSLFGCQFKQEQHGKGPVHYACELGESVFEIYPRTPKGPPTNGVRLGIVVSDVASACDRAVRRQGRLISGPLHSADGPRATILDPEGHTLDLSQKALATLA